LKSFFESVLTAAATEWSAEQVFLSAGSVMIIKPLGDNKSAILSILFTHSSSSAH
jgi:hypothetical protein